MLMLIITHRNTHAQMVFFNNVEQDFSQIDIDAIGSQETYNHYPVGAFCMRV